MNSIELIKPEIELKEDNIVGTFWEQRGYIYNIIRYYDYNSKKYNYMIADITLGECEAIYGNLEELFFSLIENFKQIPSNTIIQITVNNER
jgi:hypothetical protein